MSDKPELQVTSAESYAQLESPDDEIEIVPMPSGANWKMRRVDIQGMAMVGVLPQSLVSQGLAAWQKQGKIKLDNLDKKKAEEELAKEIEAGLRDQSIEETEQMLIFYRQIVVDNVLQPRIGYSPAGVVSLMNLDGAPVAKVQERDFRYAFKWITRQEGKEAPGLSKFHTGSERGVATASSDSTEQRSEDIIPVESTQ